jgi:tyrosyl-tRNA synthetase
MLGGFAVHSFLFIRFMPSCGGWWIIALTVLLMLHKICSSLRVARRLPVRSLPPRQASSCSIDTLADIDVSGNAQQHMIPSSFKSAFLNTMLERGFIFQCTDFSSLDDKLSAGEPVGGYLGFDATANSLHVGSLLQIMILRHFQRSGHRPVVLVGGGTTKVGDPTGKDESRKLLTDEAIHENIVSLSQVFNKFITFGNAPTDAVMVNNADWLDNLNYLSFLRDYGRLFTINRMLTYESVKQRLAREQPLTFLEFNYMLLQAYDFVELHRRHDVVLQLGGSDQWGNIVSGVELGRKVGLGSLYGLTAPLITTSDGKKMGKTASGAVWLNRWVMLWFVAVDEVFVVIFCFSL